MNKAELRKQLAEQAEEFAKHSPIYTYAESVDQAKRLKNSLETRKAPVNLTKDGFVEYVDQLKRGVYVPEIQPSDDLWRVALNRYEVQYTERGSTKKCRWPVYADDIDSAIADFKHWYKKHSLGQARIQQVIKLKDAE